MKRANYEQLICDVGDMQPDARPIVDRVLKAAGIDIPEPPVSEQIWNSTARVVGGDHLVEYNGKVIATAKTDEMLRLIIGIPTLLKACERIDLDANHPDSDGDCFIDGALIAAMRTASKDMSDD